MTPSPSRDGPPPEAFPRRVGPLATLPVFFKLEGRRALVAGSTQGALWKAELLAAAGARVIVLCGDGAAARPFERLAGELPAGCLSVLTRAWMPSDLEGAAIAVSDLPQDEAVAFAAAARASGVAVNLVDRPALSDFQFGAIVNRSPLVVSISTDGGAPVFAQELRLRLEALLPRGLGAWVQAAKSWRPALRRRALPPSERRRFWRRFSAMAWSEAERSPGEADREALFRTLGPAPARSASPTAGRAVIVAAGPGDPDLLTLRAVRALQSATVICYDESTPAPILALARREARRVALPVPDGTAARHAGERAGRDMAALARGGDYVVRLVPGDGTTAGGEMAALQMTGVSLDVVPGLAWLQGGAAITGNIDQRVA